MENRFDPRDPAYTKAYDEVKTELEAIPAEKVLPIRHDILAAIFLALGTLPKTRDLRRLALAKFGEASARFIDRLETDARACGWAHAIHLTSLHGKDVEEMAGRLSQLRTILLLEVEGLIARGLLGPSVVAELVGGTSYKGLCLDVLQLASLLRRGWTELSAFTGVTSAELDEAESLANAFATTLGENEQAGASSSTADMRRRAYTRLVETYSQVRRLATFFYWERGTADEIVPPLGAGRSSKSDDEPEVVLAVQVPGKPVIAPGMPGAPPFAAT